MRPAAYVPLIVVVVLLIASTIVGRRRGYNFGGRTIVRCRQGHVFTTVWVPGASLTSIRLGWARFQHCPVGDHWSLVTPVRDDELTPDERAMAARYHDSPIP